MIAPNVFLLIVLSYFYLLLLVLYFTPFPFHQIVNNPIRFHPPRFVGKMLYAYCLFLMDFLRRNPCLLHFFPWFLKVAWPLMTSVISKCFVNVVFFPLQHSIYWKFSWRLVMWQNIYFIFNFSHSFFSCSMQLLATLFDMWTFHVFDLRSIYVV
jgi:hypothetical protein